MSAYLNNELSTDQYIQRWLAETDGGSAVWSDPNIIARPKTRTYEHHRSKPLAQVDPTVLTTLIHPVDAREKQPRYEDGRKIQDTVAASDRLRRSSRESIHSQQLTDRGLQADTAQRRNIERDAKSNSREVKKSDETPILADPSTKYVKRARHKAKPDKYEYKGEVQAKKNVQPRKRKRTRSGSVGKEDFHAENIDAERVTLRPNCEQFVFSRSKMSMPLAGHDLPDLTFTKMDFLSRPRSSTHRASTKVPTKQDRKDDDPIKNRKAYVQTEKATKRSQTQLTFAKSDSRSEELSEPGPRGGLVQVSRSASDETSRRMMKHSSWVRSKVDPRLEEYQQECTSIDSATPISWSTSPRTNNCTRAASILQQAANESSSRKRMESEKAIPYVEQSSIRAQSSASNDICDDLVQRLSRKNVRFGAISSHQDTRKRYLSLEDLKMMSDKMSRGRPLNDPSQKRPNPVPNRPHIRLSGRVESHIVHGPSLLYTDDIAQQHQHGPQFLQPVRRQLTRGIDEAIYYADELALSEPFAPHGLDENSYINHGDIIERPRSPIVSREIYQQPNFMVQWWDSSPTCARIAEVEYERNVLDHNTYSSGKGEKQLDNFDLRLLETANIRVLQQGSSAVADLRHPNQASTVWCRPHGQTADPVFQASPLPPTALATNMLHENSLLRIGKASDATFKEQGLVIDRPSLQYEKSQSEFNPFRHGRTSF